MSQTCISSNTTAIAPINIYMHWKSQQTGKKWSISFCIDTGGLIS